MQVNSSDGSLQNRYFSGTGSIGGIHLPDFNDKYVLSKKKSGISDEEYRRQIREQAYEDFRAGIPGVLADWKIGEQCGQ